MNEIIDYKRQGLSITDISALTGHSRPTIRKYLAHQMVPRYGPREPRPTAGNSEGFSSSQASWTIRWVVP